jgi:hypothetical protein
LLFGISWVSSLINSTHITPVSTINFSESLTAAAVSWLPYTQTAAAKPTDTSFQLPTLTPYPTETLTSIPLLIPSSTPRPTATLMPFYPPTSIYVPQPPPPARSCCKICTTGKACGNSCISRSYICHQPPGCACDG